MIVRTKTTTRFGVLLAVAAFALTGCATSTQAAEQPVTAGEAVTMSDAWVKSAESGMSAGFGELSNDSDQDITVVSASTDASPMIELHETVANDSGEMVMRQKDGGFVIPAGGTFDLEPGGNHIMLMGLTNPLEAGGDVTFTLTFSDHSTYEFTAPVKDYSGANENYQEGDMNMDMDQ
ncbi:copper chaperone PCu(A)C [Microbacterium lacticum]